MVGVSNRDKLIGKERLGRYIQIVDRQRHKRIIDFAVHYPVDKFVACAGVYSDVYVRPVFLECQNYRRELVRRKRARRGPNTKPSSLSACYLGHFADRA